MAAETLVIETNSVEETRSLGACIGEACRGGEVLALIGDLGAGKTLLAKGLAAGLGVDRPDSVTSPTFVIINEYPGRLRLVHIDAYRLGGADDLEALGVAEMMNPGGVVAIEWAGRVAECIPPEALTIRIEMTGPESRRFHLQWHHGPASCLAEAISARFDV